MLQVVPHLPPPFEGVGTYAAALARELGGEGGFLVGDPAWTGSRENGARAVPARTAAALLAALDAAGETGAATGAVLLHYANYGYQPRGCPAWLVEGMERWSGRLVTVFHEVCATGPPWRSSFWLRPAQRRLAAALARRSDAIVTTLDLYAGLLHPWTADREIMVLPVFSTVGEPAALPAWGERERRIVVFGGAGVRSRAYGPWLAALERAARDLDAKEIVDIGPPIPLPAMAGGIPVRPLGVLPAGEVGAILLDVAAGFLAYPPDFLPKSTIFAAYCAHGTLPVCAWNGSPTDPANAAPYWTGSGDPAQVAGDCHRWYAGHSLRVQAARFRALLTGPPGQGRER
ncbi:MAG TPA: glycosyltransferase family 1 protein [Thermoanaerobaculia bacterium]